jgi:hypothetical protein
MLAVSFVESDPKEASSRLLVMDAPAESRPHDAWDQDRLIPL